MAWLSMTARVVVGNANSSGIVTQAFISTPNQPMTPISPVGTGPVALSIANGINDAGQVAGVVNFSSIGRSAFFWTSTGGMIALPSVGMGGSESLGYAINANGSIAGFSVIPNGALATLWAPDHTPSSLGVLPGALNYSFAYALNDSNTVVGQSGATIAGTNHLRSFLWTSAGGMVDLGDLGDPTHDSSAQGINNEGEVVGSIAVTGAPAGGQNGYIWTSALGMRNLNGLLDSSGAGWVISSASGINRYGQIIATAYNTAGGFQPRRHPFTQHPWFLLHLLRRLLHRHPGRLHSHRRMDRRGHMRTQPLRLPTPARVVRRSRAAARCPSLPIARGQTSGAWAASAHPTPARGLLPQRVVRGLLPLYQLRLRVPLHLDARRRLRPQYLQHSAGCLLSCTRLRLHRIHPYRLRKRQHVDRRRHVFSQYLRCTPWPMPQRVASR